MFIPSAIGYARHRMRFFPKVTVFALVLAGVLLSARNSGAYTQVQISTGAPTGIEENFIAATTAQFTGKVIKNPLAAHTYSLILYGLNPSYQAPEPPPTNLEQALSLGATVYVYRICQWDGLSK